MVKNGWRNYVPNPLTTNTHRRFSIAWHFPTSSPFDLQPPFPPWHTSRRCLRKRWRKDVFLWGNHRVAFFFSQFSEQDQEKFSMISRIWFVHILICSMGWNHLPTFTINLSQTEVTIPVPWSMWDICIYLLYVYRRDFWISSILEGFQNKPSKKGREAQLFPQQPRVSF